MRNIAKDLLLPNVESDVEIAADRSRITRLSTGYWKEKRREEKGTLNYRAVYAFCYRWGTSGSLIRIIFSLCQIKKKELQALYLKSVSDLLL